jgi:hypothetical protein
MKVRRISRLFLPLLFLLALPASAQASWTAPIDLSLPGFDAGTPQVAVDGTGRAIFVWALNDGTTGCAGHGCERVQARVRSADGTLGLVQDLTTSGDDNHDPAVAVNANGDAVVVWVHGAGAGLAGRTLSSTGTLGPIQAIATNPADGYGVAIDPNANAIFFWTSVVRRISAQCPNPPCYYVRTRRLSSAGTLGTTQTLSAPDQNAQDPEAGVDANGNATFVWMSCTRSSSPSCSLQARARSASGTLSATQQLSGSAAGQPQVAVDPNGDATFVWTYRDPTSCCNVIQTRTRSPGGGLSTAQTLSDPTGGYVPAYLPQVALDPTGNAVFTWERYDGTSDCGGSACLRVQTRSRSTAGALSAVQTLSAVKSNAEYPQVGIDQNDTAVFAWWSRNLKLIRARTRSATGVLSATQTISDPTEPTSSPALDENTSTFGNVPPLALAVNPAGNAVADWFGFDGVNYRIDGAAGP